MNVLILGGTGAMGANFVQIMAEKGYDLIVTSRRERKSNYNNVLYIKGNAKEDIFLNEILKDGPYDAIVDYMSYSTDLFKTR